VGDLEKKKVGEKERKGTKQSLSEGRSPAPIKAGQNRKKSDDKRRDSRKLEAIDKEVGRRKKKRRDPNGVYDSCN